MKITILDRILLFITSLVSAYQIAVGIEGFSTLPMISYSIAFGVLLIATLLMLILGLEVLDSAIVVIVSTIIPLSLATGLVWQHLPNFKLPYSIFAIAGLFAIIVTRAITIKNRLPLFVLIFVHGVAGLTIFLVPLMLVLSGRMPLGYILLSIGGALMGLGGLLLALHKAGKPYLSRKTIIQILPGLLLLMTVLFVIGFALT
ncbi:MAG: hypothetical protein ACD_34C00250G0005 [uncultured bacterium]|nr:MAG: hypothetical protein ACD_34C00250G0005 [uncultured bacterium]HCS38424.1 hypothetical protein [Anaerolineaceae bacterium]